MLKRRPSKLTQHKICADCLWCPDTQGEPRTNGLILPFRHWKLGLYRHHGHSCLLSIFTCMAETGCCKNTWMWSFFHGVRERRISVYRGSYSCDQKHLKRGACEWGMSRPEGQTRWPGACSVREIDEARGSVMAHPCPRRCPCRLHGLIASLRLPITILFAHYHPILIKGNTDSQLTRGISLNYNHPPRKKREKNKNVPVTLNSNTCTHTEKHPSHQLLIFLCFSHNFSVKRSGKSNSNVGPSAYMFGIVNSNHDGGWKVQSCFMDISFIAV